MKVPRYIHNIYCDDIRTEISQKTIYIGVYGHDMLIQTDAKGPVMQRICIHSSIISPSEQTISKVVYSLKLNGKTVHQSEALGNPNAKIDPSIAYIMHESNLTVNLQLDSESTLCMCAKIDDDEEIAGPELRISIDRRNADKNTPVEVKN